MNAMPSGRSILLSEFVVHDRLLVPGCVDRVTYLPGSSCRRESLGHFSRSVRKGKVKGKLAADAVHAALAIESGGEWVTADTDFARFVPGLRWRHL